MSPRDQKIVLVALLFTAAGGAAYWQLRDMSLAGGANAGQAAKQVEIPPAKRILGDSLNNAEDSIATSGRNIFSFGREVIVAPPPPPVTIQRDPPPAPVIRTPPTTAPPTTTVSSANANLPARVQINYTGYARDDANQMLAILETTGNNAGHYLLRADDFLLGRIRVNKITADSIEVEDMERSETSTVAISPTIAPKK